MFFEGSYCFNECSIIEVFVSQILHSMFNIIYVKYEIFTRDLLGVSRLHN